MTDDPRIRFARRMREDGKQLDEIADAFGVSKATVSRWTVPGALERDRAKSQAWKDRNRAYNRARDVAFARSARGRGLCDGCGMPKGAGRARKGVMCAGCVQAVATVRRTITEGMWADGWTCREICDVLEVTETSYVCQARARGWDLPHRRSPEQVARIRAGSMAGRGLAA